MSESFMFATCDPVRAIEFLKVLYPSKVDIESKAIKLLDYVKRDVVRIQDPMMHSPAEVVPGKNWTEGIRDEVVLVCKEFHSA